MKSINFLQNFAKLKDLTSGNARHPHTNLTVRERENDFSFSPDNSKQISEGLSNILSKSFQSPNRNPASTSRSKSPSSPFKNPEAPLKHSFHPVINKKSIQIIKQAEKQGKDIHSKKKDILPQPQPEETSPQKKISLKDFIDRNYKQQLPKYESKKPTTPITILDKVDSQCTFRPKIDPRSKEMIHNHRVDFYEQAVKREEEKKIERKKNAQKKETEELKECTFSPNLLKKKYVNSSNQTSTPEPRSYSIKYSRTLSPFTKKIN